MVLILTAVSAAVGADTSASVTYQVFALLFLLVVTSFFISLTNRKKPQIRRRLPAMATAGMELSFPVEVTIKSRKPVEGVFIAELGPDPRPSFMEFAHIREPGEEKRNWVDRMYAYYRWKWQLRRNRSLEADTSRKFTLFGDRVNTLHVSLIPLKRGVMKLHEIVIGIPDPLGLTYSLHVLKVPQSILVLPERVPMPAYEFPGASNPNNGSMARGSSGGTEEDFINLRDYRPGDALKQIHWVTSAKARKLIVREYQTTSRARCGIILDTCCPVSRAFDFEKLVIVASSIAGAGEAGQIDLDFLFVGTEAHCFSTGPGQGDVSQLMEVLATVEYSGEDMWAPLVRVVEENSEKLQGATVLTMHWDDDRKALARYLTLNGIPNQIFVLNESNKTIPHNGSGVSPDEEFPQVVFLDPDQLEFQLNSL